MRRISILECIAWFSGVAVVGGSPCLADSLVTTNAGEVAAFQVGTSVFGFDAIPGNGGGGGFGAPGTVIQPASQVTDQFRNAGVLFSSTGGPIGVVSVQGLPNQTDARSPFNVVGGSVFSGGVPRLDYFEPIRLDFVDPGTGTPDVTDRVGAWNDPTGSRIRLEVFNRQGTPLESVEAGQGMFVGITRPGIATAVFSYVSTQTTPGFSLDDITVGTIQALPVPAISGIGRWALPVGFVIAAAFLMVRRQVVV